MKKSFITSGPGMLRYLCCESIYKSNVNGRHFSEVTNSDLD